jgi:hypothetical protein
MSDEKYFNFPIQLLEGFMKNSEKVIMNIKDYAVYENSLKLEHGTDLQQIKDSANFYNMKLGNVNDTYKNGLKLYRNIPIKSPKVGMNLSIWWDFYKNEKTEFDKICLLAFLSIKSLIGAKPYYKATNLYLWARMDGKINAIVEVSELSVEVRKFANEYQTTKIKTALRNSWGLVHYARYTRGFYVSFKFTLKQLILEAEKCRISTKEKQYKEQEKEALKEVLEQLKTTRPK